MEIEDIANQESILIAHIHDVNASGHDSIRLLKESGAFDVYRTIHQQYVDLAVKQHDLEALKRAVFIQWYTKAEPSWLSGIGELDQSSEISALSELQQRVLNGEIDEEFEWMLKCYYQVLEAFITSHKGFERLIKHLRIRPSWEPRLALKFSFDGRGQMGSYWLSRMERTKLI